MPRSVVSRSETDNSEIVAFLLHSMLSAKNILFRSKDIPRCLASGMCCFLAAGSFLFLSCQEKRLDRFEREAKEYTIRNCPKQIDPVTTLDSLVFHNDGSLNYSYYYHVALSDEQLHAFKTQLSDIEENTLRALRASIDLRPVKEAELNIEYIYLNADDGQQIAKFHFTKDQYQ